MLLCYLKVYSCVCVNHLLFSLFSCLLSSLVSSLVLSLQWTAYSCSQVQWLWDRNMVIEITCTIIHKCGSEYIPFHFITRLCTPLYLLSQWTCMNHAWNSILKVYRAICTCVNGDHVLYILSRGKVFHAQMSLYKTHACKEYRENYPALFEVCGYRSALEWPQLPRL